MMEFRNLLMEKKLSFVYGINDVFKFDLVEKYCFVNGRSLEAHDEVFLGTSRVKVNELGTIYLQKNIRCHFLLRLEFQTW